MPVKANSFQPRIYTKTEAKYRIHYVLYWEKGDRKFHRGHDGRCTCGKPRPNKPCEHLKAAQESLRTFENHMAGKAMDAPVAYLIDTWLASNHVKRGADTVKLYANTFKLFNTWCDAQGIKTSSELLETPGKRPMADFFDYMESTPYRVLKHTSESKKMLRNIDYVVRRDKIRRDSPEFQQPEYQELVRTMEAAMEARIDHYSKATIYRTFRELNVLFTFAVHKKLMTANPLDERGTPTSLRLISKPGDSDSKRNSLTPEEQVVLLDHLTGDMRDIAIVLIYAGLRIGELCNLHWNHVKIGPKECWLEISPVNGWIPKWGTTRTIPMHPRIKEVIERQRKMHPGSEYVFVTGNGTKYGKWNLQHDFREVFNKLDIKGVEGTRVTVHSFRHTFISTQFVYGENIIKIKQMAGHKDIRTTMRYAHDLDKRKSSVMHLIP